MTESSPPSRHAGNEVGAGDGPDVLLESNLRAGNAALAGAVVVDRAAIERRGQRGEAFGALLQLSVVEGRVDAKVVEEREHHRAGDGDAVLGIGGQAGIAADRGHAVDRQRHLDALVVLRIGGIARNATAVGIGQLEVDAVGHIAVRRSPANIEAAQLVLAAGVEAVVGRSHIAAEALHIAQLRAQAQYVASVVRRDQVVHGHEALVGHQRRDVAHVAPMPAAWKTAVYSLPVRGRTGLLMVS